MSFLDGTGPLGQGAMTGRGLGPCNPNARPPVIPAWRAMVGNPARGLGRGLGPGGGRGFGRYVWTGVAPNRYWMNGPRS